MRLCIYILGKVQAYLKSAPPPKDEQKGPVRVLVGSTFERVVNDPSKDVLVEFYAPWCGHCKSFEPKFKQFAARFKTSEPNLIVAKFDATVNDPPSNYKVEGFPTIYFAPGNGKEKPIKYEGNRELKDLEEFIRKHATKSFKAAQKEKEEKDEL